MVHQSLKELLYLEKQLFLKGKTKVNTIFLTFFTSILSAFWVHLKSESYLISEATCFPLWGDWVHLLHAHYNEGGKSGNTKTNFKNKNKANITTKMTERKKSMKKIKTQTSKCQTEKFQPVKCSNVWLTHHWVQKSSSQLCHNPKQIFKQREKLGAPKSK